LCDECREHYETVKAFLDGAGVSYIEDYKLVRGLDYYTRTVFEVQVDNGMGSQNAIGGGGRYDKLAEEVGGRPTPGFGFALGYERCALALQAAGVEFKRASACKLFVATVEAQARSAAFDLVQQCRDAGVATEMDHQARSLKSQFKLADKLGASYVAVLGPDEIAQSVVNLRNMQTHEETQVALCEVASKLV
jgi:histidyl-tRNA synthetase